MATDLSSAMIDEVKQRIQVESWNNVDTNTLDARDLSSLKENLFTHVFTNLGLPVPGDLTSSSKVTAEIFRVLKPGGVALISTWADRVWLTAFHNAGLAIRPNESPQTLMTLSSEVLRASWLAAQLEEGGFRNNIEIRPCVTYTQARSLDELVDNMMLAKEVFFAGYSDEELVRVKEVFK